MNTTELIASQRAIEHAEYLAKGAESLLNYLNDISDIEEGVIKPDDNYADFTGSLKNYVYEFRKRAAKFAELLAKRNAEPVKVMEIDADMIQAGRIAYEEGNKAFARKDDIVVSIYTAMLALALPEQARENINEQ